MFLGSGNCGIAWKRLRHRNASSNETEHEESTRFLTAHGGIWVSRFLSQGKAVQCGGHLCAVERSPAPWLAIRVHEAKLHQCHPLRNGDAVTSLDDYF